MSSYSYLPKADPFQQIIYTPAGTIDVIAIDQRARLQNARILARGVSGGLALTRRGAAQLLRALASRIDRAPDEAVRST